MEKQQQQLFCLLSKAKMAKRTNDKDPQVNLEDEDGEASKTKSCKVAGSAKYKAKFNKAWEKLCSVRAVKMTSMHFHVYPATKQFDVTIKAKKMSKIIVQLEHISSVLRLSTVNLKFPNF